jgi:oxygen-independent coproporphyrinogen III oxidase
MGAPSLDLPPPWLLPRAAYVHVPFCAHHCGYCDFAVTAGRDELIGPYLDALAAEVGTLGAPWGVETIFLGGGTPSYLSPGQLARLLETIARWLPLERGGEYTVEANPESLTAEKVELLAVHGVNRVSLGAQSFDRDLLRVLERAHDPDEVPRAVERARRRVPRVSLDLIFGVPGQSLEGWRQDLDRALALAPDHLSTYGLTYEKGTPLWKQRRAGRLRAVGEEDELAMYSLAIDVLTGAGFEHYEISNFARPGCRSRHNQTYWANEAYLGFGLGAARYVNGRREVNTRDLPGYIKRALAGEPVTRQGEDLPPQERARETMAVQLRRCEGIDREVFERQTGRVLDEVAGPALAALVEQGLLIDDGQRVFLSREGKYVADGVIERLL